MRVQAISVNNVAQFEPALSYFYTSICGTYFRDDRNTLRGFLFISHRGEQAGSAAKEKGELRNREPTDRFRIQTKHANDREEQYSYSEEVSRFAGSKDRAKKLVLLTKSFLLHF
jgi:hypothetical protein